MKSVPIQTRPRPPAERTGCAVEVTLSVIGGLWKPVILFHLLNGKLRFNALCRVVPNATARMVRSSCESWSEMGHQSHCLSGGAAASGI
ncbi:winged helix-turn-helix transcriptional regulator [Devosia neptuniae]|uniref:winged helix-turn-helix transcriptional regulator n=1 Tax=Devosia neptuniae TaxID=191302 RepID=UPI0036F3E1D9